MKEKLEILNNNGWTDSFYLLTTYSTVRRRMKCLSSELVMFWNKGPKKKKRKLKFLTEIYFKTSWAKFFLLLEKLPQKIQSKHFRGLLWVIVVFSSEVQIFISRR